MITAIIIILCVLLVVAVAAASSAVRVLREYERGVMFRLGPADGAQGPGPGADAPVDRPDGADQPADGDAEVPPQEIITRDNIPARVTAVTYYRVIDPSRAVTEVENYESATLQIAQTSLRSVLGAAELDTLLAEREHLNESLQQVIDSQTEPWGIKVTAVEIKDVEIPERMQHAIARQAEAERERRAKIINAEGEFQAAAKLRDAADVMGDSSVTLQLRYLQTLREIGGTQNSTIVFPIPMDVVGADDRGDRARTDRPRRRQQRGARCRPGVRRGRPGRRPSNGPGSRRRPGRSWPRATRGPECGAERGRSGRPAGRRQGRARGRARAREPAIRGLTLRTACACRRVTTEPGS